MRYIVKLRKLNFSFCSAARRVLLDYWFRAILIVLVGVEERVGAATTVY